MFSDLTLSDEHLKLCLLAKIYQQILLPLIAFSAAYTSITAGYFVFNDGYGSITVIAMAAIAWIVDVVLATALLLFTSFLSMKLFSRITKKYPRLEILTNPGYAMVLSNQYRAFQSSLSDAIEFDVDHDPDHPIYILADESMTLLVSLIEERPLQL